MKLTLLALSSIYCASVLASTDSDALIKKSRDINDLVGRNIISTAVAPIDLKMTRENLIGKIRMASSNFQQCIQNTENEAANISTSSYAQIKERLKTCSKFYFTLGDAADFSLRSKVDPGVLRGRFCFGMFGISTGNLLTFPCLLALGGDTDDLDWPKKMISLDLFREENGRLAKFRPKSNSILKRKNVELLKALSATCNSLSCYEHITDDLKQ